MRLESCGDVLSVADVQQVLGVGRNAVYEGIRTGQIPSVRLGSRILVPKAALIRMLESANGPNDKED